MQLRLSNDSDAVVYTVWLKFPFCAANPVECGHYHLPINPLGRSAIHYARRSANLERAVSVGPAVDRRGLCVGVGAERAGGAGPGRDDSADRGGEREVVRSLPQAAVISTGDCRHLSCFVPPRPTQRCHLLPGLAGNPLCRRRSPAATGVHLRRVARPGCRRIGLLARAVLHGLDR